MQKYGNECMRGLLVLVAASGWARAEWSIGTVAGGGNGQNVPATSVAFTESVGVTTDVQGNLFVADRNGQTVWKIDPAGLITRFAGTGEFAFSENGDGGPAAQAKLANPTGVAKDAAGNLYIAEDNSRIRKVSPSGTITTYAGTATQGYSGDGGPAISAMLRQPEAVAVDGAGNVYVADSGNHRVRKITAAGIITTIAGTGTAGFSGDAGQATLAKLNDPRRIAVDTAGNLYIGDANNNRIRKVSATTGVITTVAGNGSPGNSGDGQPATSVPIYALGGVAFDPSGNMYIGSLDQVRKVNAAGTISRVAGGGAAGLGDGGPALEATFRVSSVWVNGSGDLYIAHSDGLVHQRIRKVTNTTQIITTVAGGGDGQGIPATLASLKEPWGVLPLPGNLFYFADRSADRIWLVDAAGLVFAAACTGSRGFSGDGGPAVSAKCALPTFLVQDADGTLYISDSENHRVRRVRGSEIVTVAGSGPVWPSQGAFSGDQGPATSARLYVPRGLALDGKGGLYIADSQNHRIRKLDLATGVISTVAGGGSALGDNGPAASAKLVTPYGIALDSAGNLLIADTGQHRVRKVSPAGIISTLAGNGLSGFAGDGAPATAARLASPYAVVPGGSGEAYIADTLNNRIRFVDASGLISSVAGGGATSQPGDGGPALSASLQPTSLWFDATGQLYAGDRMHLRIRRLSRENQSPQILSAPTADPNPVDLLP